MNTILNQPYHRRVLTDQLDREDSQLAASLESESGPTPAGKTLPYSNLKIRFRRERVRYDHLFFDVLHSRPATMIYVIGINMMTTNTQYILSNTLDGAKYVMY